MKKLIVLIFPLLVLSSCMDWLSDEPTLPKVTTKGANTFGCKIDGKVYVPYFSSFMSNQSLFPRFTFRFDGISVTAFNQNWKNGNNSCETTILTIFFPIDSQLNLTGSAFVIYRECGNGEGYNPKDGDRKRFEANLSNNPIDENYFELLRFETIQSDTGRSVNAYFACRFRAKVVSEDGEVKMISSGRFDVNFSNSKPD